MLPKLSDIQKAAVFSVLVLSLGVVAALLIRVPNLGADEWGWASIREINQLLAALIMLLVPALAYPLAPTLLIVPDLGYLIVISSVVALAWGIARPPLTYFTLRRPSG